MKKILIAFLILTLFSISVQAKSVKGELTDIINDSGIRKNSVSISIRDLNNGKIVYALNDQIMMNPASVQKAITMTAANATLGKDYKFITELYSDNNDSYVIKLSGDPYLKYSDLKSLTKSIKKGAKNIYIDNSILDTKYWGEGWQWDDDLNELMPKFGAYNLDKNLIKLIVVPSEAGQFATIVNPSKYPLVLISNVMTANKTAISINREPSISANTLILNGTVAKQKEISIPSNDIKLYFEIQLKRALAENNIYLSNSFDTKNEFPDYKSINSIEHELSYALTDILKNSNNMAAETIFKLAGGKYKGQTGSDTAGIEMFKDFCSKHNIDYSSVKITDGSGVSKNNLMTTDFISNFLYINKDSNLKEYLPKPGEGTLVQRMLPLKDNLKAKTGTLSNTSTIAGYLTTKKGGNYAFCIMQNDIKLSPAEQKTLEDYIIRAAYLKL